MPATSTILLTAPSLSAARSSLELIAYREPGCSGGEDGESGGDGGGGGSVGGDGDDGGEGGDGGGEGDGGGLGGDGGEGLGGGGEGGGRLGGVLGGGGHALHSLYLDVVSSPRCTFSLQRPASSQEHTSQVNLQNN